MLTTTDGRSSRSAFEEPLLICAGGEKYTRWSLANYIPFLSWSRTITKQDVCKDLLAGVTVGVLLIPQSMSYAALAHLPPEFGLYTGFIPLIVFAFLTSSYHISIGPVAPVCVLVGDAVLSIIGDEHIDDITEYGDEMFQQAASGLALVAGVILVCMSILRLGFLAKFLSIPVMTGFVTGAAFIIFGNQLKGIFGLECEKTSYFYSTFYYAMAGMGTIHWRTTLISVLGLTFLCGCKYFNAPRWFPAPFILMFVTTMLSYFMGFKEMGIMIVGDLPSGIPPPTIPHIFGSSSVIIQGFIVAVVAYVGSLGLAKSLARDSPFPYEISANSELVAYGMASLVGSFFGGFPPAASFSRSALAFEMQARTPFHGIFTATLMCIALYLTVAFKFLPKCVLAVVIVMSVRRLFQNGYKEVTYLIRARSRDFFECMICMIGVCVLGITHGIMIGFVMSFINYMYGNSFAAISTKNPSDVLPDRTRQSTEGKEGDRTRQTSEGHKKATTGKPSPAGGPAGGPREKRVASFSISMPKQQAVVIQPGAGVFYANASKVADSIKDAVRNIGDTLVLDLRYSPCLDSTAARGILDSLKDAADVVNNIVISNCGDTVNADLNRYASSDAHKALLEHTIKIISKDY